MVERLLQKPWQFKKDSIEFLQYKHRRDSLEHLLDSLRRMSIPVLACSGKVNVLGKCSRSNCLLYPKAREDSRTKIKRTSI